MGWEKSRLIPVTSLHRISFYCMNLCTTTLLPLTFARIHCLPGPKEAPFQGSREGVIDLFLRLEGVIAEKIGREGVNEVKKVWRCDYEKTGVMV